MSINLPELVDIDHTRLDFQGIINLATQVITNHPEYFSEVDDYTQGNAGRMTIELISYIIELLADRVDWIANELLLPTATQKENVMNLLKLINYRLKLPTTAGVTVRAAINTYIPPFVIPARYSVPGKDRDGNQIRFEMLMKNADGKYIYEGVGSSYEFDTNTESSPDLTHNDLPFYQGRSHQEFFTMGGVDNESVFLEKQNIEEGSIRAWKITRNTAGEIISKRSLSAVNSFISPEAQAASDSGLPPYKIEPTENNAVYLIFGERPVVATFSTSGNEEIMVWYRTTLGNQGNVPRGSINYNTNLVVNGKTIRLSLVNTIAGSGGGEAETIEHAKRYGPLSITTVNKTVNPEDFIIILQNYSALMNAIAFGKSNEPSLIKEEYGYYIPPYEIWIYPIFNKAGWESFPTYSYQKEMMISRPYSLYGPIEKEEITIDDVNGVDLEKLRNNAYNNNYANIAVSDFFNKKLYIAGADYVIDMNSEQLIVLEGGSIVLGQTVIVQYYENNNRFNESKINFATGNIQDIPRSPVYPGITSYAWNLNTQKILKENTLSVNDFNYPNNDYKIDYSNNQIIKNPTYPSLTSYESLGEDIDYIPGINNRFILELDGINNPQYNSSHDIEIYSYRSLVNIGNGSDMTFPNGNYYFSISIDNDEHEEYMVYLDTTYTTEELANKIYNDAVDYPGGTKHFYDLPVEIFADSYTYTSGPLTIMSNTKGINSNIEIGEGHSEISTLLRPGLSDLTYKNSETLDIFETSARLRYAFNSINLCNGFRGQELQAGEKEKPEIYSVSNLDDVSNFSLTSTNNKILIEIQGTGLATFDGSHEITLNTPTSNTYDLNRIQGQLSLINDIQYDIDNTSGLSQDIIKVFWLKNEYNNYRIGFKLLDTNGSSRPYIAVYDASSDSARSTLKFNNGQSSEEGNILEARIDPSSNMFDSFLLNIELLGAFGPRSLLKTKSTNSINDNTLSLLKFGKDQFSKGSGIYNRTIIGEKDLLGGDTLLYNFDSTNNKLDLGITSGVGIDDENYELTIPEGEYNINELVYELNNSLITAESFGSQHDISNFIKFEKQEGLQRIRLIMNDFDPSDTPDIIISNMTNTEINSNCAIKLGFNIGQKLSEYSTIILHYGGDWAGSDAEDSSEESSIIRFLDDKKLITQDYIIRDPKLTGFDLKGKVYCSKGFDRNIIKDKINEKIKEKFALNNREFRDSAAISNITKLIEKIEGTVYTTIEYFGKNYQLYKKYLDKSKSAIIRGNKPAELISDRWSEKSAFKITLDGTAEAGINYDGEYLVIVGNSWTAGDYDSLLDAIINGDGLTGGISHAIPTTMGRSETNLGIALEVTHSSGIFAIKTKNEGPRVMLKIEDPDDIFTYGYQNFSRTTNIKEDEYYKNTNYRFYLTINGQSQIVYTITSPASGKWGLSQIASDINEELPSDGKCGIDENGKIRITSTLGGNQSTINIEVAYGEPGRDLISLLNGVESPVGGNIGYISCINSNDGSLYIDSPSISYGLEKLPDERYNFRNFNDEIPAKYNEILVVNDDQFSGNDDIENQKHGIILDYIELGKGNN